MRPHHTLICLGAVVTALWIGASPASAGSASFTNATKITIPDKGTASPSPSTVDVSGLAGPITDLVVTLHGVTHTDPSDFGVLLVSPSGTEVVLMNGNCGSADVANFTWIFDDRAADAMPDGEDCPGLVYRPNARGVPDGFTGAPTGPPYRRSMADFVNARPNGTWRLFVQDFRGGDSGSIARGWTLAIGTREPDMKLPATGTAGAGNPHPATLNVTEAGIVTDVNVTLDGIWHERPDDLDVLLVGPHGQRVVLMSDACGTHEVNAYGWVWDDEAPGLMPDGDDTDACNQREYRPSDYEGSDRWESPAPAGPFAGRLSAFDGTEAAGVWSLYVEDDTLGATGFFTNRFQLHLETRQGAAVSFAEPTVSVPEGERRVLTLRREPPAGGTLGVGSVRVTTVATGATPMDDYTPISVTATFQAGETETRVLVDAVADDDPDEPDEGYVVAASEATGDASIPPSTSAAVTIPAQKAQPTPTPAPAPSATPAPTTAPDPTPAPTVIPEPTATAIPVAARCAGRPATIVGTAGRDVLRGTAGPDVIVASAGDDVIRAAGGDDTVCAGPGDDRLRGGRGADRCFGGPGRDRATCERRRSAARPRTHR